MDIDRFKSHIQVIAVQARWRPDQIQLAEDYIDRLAKKGLACRRPLQLKLVHATLILDEFKKFS